MGWRGGCGPELMLEPAGTAEIGGQRAEKRRREGRTRITGVRVAEGDASRGWSGLYQKDLRERIRQSGEGSCQLVTVVEEEELRRQAIRTDKPKED
jgi:hypothetical protein